MQITHPNLSVGFVPSAIFGHILAILEEVGLAFGRVDLGRWRACVREYRIACMYVQILNAKHAMTHLGCSLLNMCPVFLLCSPVYLGVTIGKRRGQEETHLSLKLKQVVTGLSSKRRRWDIPSYSCTAVYFNGHCAPSL